MMTFCPSCSRSVAPQLETAGGRQIWRCGSCGLVLKDEAAPAPASSAGGKGEQVLGRIAVTRVSAAEALAVRAEAEARAAAQAAARQKPKRTPAPAPASEGAREEAIELPEDDGEFVLETAGAERAISHAPEPPAAPSPTPAAAAGPAPAGARPTAASGTVFERVFLVDGADALRGLLKQALLQGHVAAEVTAFGTGEQFLQAATAQLTRGPIALAVVDLDLMGLGGPALALALRAVERGLGAAPTPLLFFTARPCDAAYQRLIELCQPARYLGKGAEGPQQAAARLVQVLASLRR